ncbi:metalloprotease PmbA [Endozoicomonas sp. OPT23]|uniref:metalloprotease PmbA n=1 Tax=Endozoicomonas sp. OPT23 TaxID=2072845 RepID=UPI00129BB81D|nr:metalloprotease PmbA [Endozoicomonas sp. OPT23]MRI34134.1 metalloprotease PmbA [Endozoicomonas sp. OPT23]
MADTGNAVLDPRAEEDRLKNLVSDILAEAKKQGADACEVGVSLDAGLSVGVRMGDVETVEFNRDQGFGITVYQGKRKGSASTSDSTQEAIRETVKAACDIAGYGSEDPCAGLADADLMATNLPDLDLYHPWGIDAEQAIELALKSEEAGRKFSKKIINSDGANVGTHQGCRVYGNSHGFIGSYVSSRHSLSAVLIGEKNGEMQRDYWYTVARDGNELDSAVEVGEKAAQRTVDRLGPRRVPTAQVPVLFAAEIASGLIGSLMGAISGGNLYRQSSFLLDHLGKQIFPEWVHIHEQPLLKKAMGSASFDNDGLATRAKDFITDGVLSSYLLSTYSARKLGMESTANAGGINNLFMDSNAGDQQELLKQMGTGLLVTELMGQGVNTVTGDYSRGAGGYWVENGVIQFPVSEVTIAGNLKDMFMNMVAAGSDYDRRGNVQTGSILISEMQLAGE